MNRLFLISYRILLFLIRRLMPVVALFSKKIKQRYQVERQQKFSTLSDVVWFHAASLGEYEQALPIIHELKQRQPQLNITVTFFSASGYNFAMKQPDAQVHSYWYLPLESPRAYQTILNHWEVKAVILIKYELWYELLHQLCLQNVPVYWFAVVLYPQHFLTKSWAKPYLKFIRQFTKITVQDKQSEDILKSIGIPSIQINEPRYDRVSQQLANRPAEVTEVMNRWKVTKPIVVFGSVWASDIEVWIEWIQQYHQQYSFVFAPHDVSSVNVEKMVRTLDIPLQRWTSLESQEIDSSHLMVDKIGQLRYLYSYATWAYVGGGFHNQGIHNTLESLTYGVPVVVGPKRDKFPEVNLFAAEEILCVLPEAKDIEQTIETIEHISSDKVSQFMQSKRGGGKAHADLLCM